MNNDSYSSNSTSQANHSNHSNHNNSHSNNHSNSNQNSHSQNIQHQSTGGLSQADMDKIDARRRMEKEKREAQLKKDSKFGSSLNDQNEMMSQFERDMF